jgi:chromosome segregation protein
MTDGGAHFRRCDFQVHTPRDNQWKGSRATTPEERRDYAVRFVEACRRKELHAVAITDHHDFALFPHIKMAAHAETDDEGNPLPPDRRLVVFPGLELTLGVPCQALLILDADFATDRLTSVLEALSVDPVDDDVEALPPVIRLDKIQTLEQLYDELDSRPWLKRRYLVLPNVTDKGHGTLMRAGMQAKYKTMPCVGGYLDGTVDTKVGKGNRRIFDGADKNWGNHRLALFQTSDCRVETFESLGEYSTWVKWAVPTAEAIRQACLAEESRISHLIPQLPTVFISRLSVSNSKFLGPIDIAFNPQYNAVIGGRGTGKSTILDYLRWGLCDQAAQAGDDELANPTVRRERLIENTLRTVNGQVEVYFTINDIPHIVRRASATGEIALKVGTDEFAKVREEHVRALLPIHAYSQKQLSSVALRTDELTRFVTAPVQRALDTLDQRITEVSGKLRENYAKVQRARALETAIGRQRLAEKSLSEQAANLRKSLTDLSDEDRRVLDAKPDYDAVREALDGQERDLDELIQFGDQFLARVATVRERLVSIDDAPAEMNNVLSQLGMRREQELATLEEGVANVLGQTRHAREPGAPEYSLSHAARTAIGDFDDLYNVVKRRSTVHQAKLDELAEVEQRRTDAAQLLNEHQRDRTTLGEPSQGHAELRSELLDLLRERTDLLAEESDRLTVLSEGLLRASINRGRGLAAVEQKFKGFIQGSGVRSGKVDQLFTRLSSETDPLGTWEDVLGELEEILQLEEDVEHTSESTPVLTRLEFPLADQQRIRSRITADGWLDLALTPIKDEPVFEYQTKEEEFIAFSAASAGQQATALLRVLLAQTGIPLIIDQPEEDLDSQVVQDVVTRIWGAKKRRQLLFASHNANLVVNGDAELVVAFDYRKQGDQSGGRIKFEGAIDMPEVREEITRVMEGGEKAFRLRKEKYGF